MLALKVTPACVSYSGAVRNGELIINGCSRSFPGFTSLWNAGNKRQQKTLAAVAKAATIRGLDEGDPHTYQYLQKSSIPTQHFQKSLPRLPIPPLIQTCERYLAALKPLVSDKQHAKTTRLADEFRAGTGKMLDAELRIQDKANKHTSYISKMWSEMYLKARTPLPLNYNPFISMNDDPDKSKMQQGVRAANFVISALRFKRSLDESILEPDLYHLNPKKSDNARFRSVTSWIPSRVAWYPVALLYKVFPLDASQYGRLFSTCRIPKQDYDTLETYSESKHILLLCNGRMYALDVLDVNGLILSASNILRGIENVLERNRNSGANDTSRNQSREKNRAEGSPPPVWALTGLERNAWAAARELLVEQGNIETLKLVESAIFHVCLDDVYFSGDIDESNYEQTNKLVTGATNTFLHGAGSARWFDKSISAVITRCGRAALTFEHAWGDGVAVLRLLKEIHRDITANNYVADASSAKKEQPVTKPPPSTPIVQKEQTIAARIDAEAGGPTELSWQLDDNLRNLCAEAHKDLLQRTDRFRVTFLKSPLFGKKALRQMKLSTDGLMQLAFQMAYFKVHAETVPTYESCSTAAFLHGRTETIRPATMLTKRLSEMFASGQLEKPSADALPQIKQLLKESSITHSRLIREAAMGNGFDRHLFALKYIGETQQNLKNMPLFEDASYKRLNYNIMSTSSLTEKGIQLGGFGPVVPDGLGIGYSFQDDWIGCVVTSYEGQQQPLQFRDALEEGLGQLHRILLDSSSTPASAAINAAA